MRRITKIIAAVCLVPVLAVSAYAAYWQMATSDVHVISKPAKKNGYTVVTKYHTPNISEGRNTVDGIVLHHTAAGNVNSAIARLCAEDVENRVSCHVVIDRDGTRYVLAPPSARTMHAGMSMLNGRGNCNKFTVGIEFQGNTCLYPLTEAQIQSGIEYMLPLIKKYDIPLDNIVSHKQVRDNWLRKHHGSTTPAKPDIVDSEYKRFMKALRKRLEKRNG